jgi:hypothetical protein
VWRVVPRASMQDTLTDTVRVTRQKAQFTQVSFFLGPAMEFCIDCMCALPLLNYSMLLGQMPCFTRGHWTQKHGGFGWVCSRYIVGQRADPRVRSSYNTTTS